MSRQGTMCWRGTVPWAPNRCKIDDKVKCASSAVGKHGLKRRGIKMLGTREKQLFNLNCLFGGPYGFYQINWLLRKPWWWSLKSYTIFNFFFCVGLSTRYRARSKCCLRCTEGLKLVTFDQSSRHDSRSGEIYTSKLIMINSDVKSTKRKFSITHAVSFNIFVLYLNACIICKKEENYSCSLKTLSCKKSVTVTE